MPEHLQQRPKLLIISHTDMWYSQGEYYAFEPVVRELESIQNLFSSITWIGYLNEDKVPGGNSRKFSNADVRFVTLKKIGGNNVKDKIEIGFNSVAFLKIIRKEIAKADVIYTRAPSFPAFIGICLSFFYKKKIWWHKYAGNWNEADTYYSFRLQRQLLRKLKHTHVTINGVWPNQEEHLLSFQNPCLYDEEIIEGKEAGSKKNFDGKIKICFIGRLDLTKGAKKIVDAAYIMKQKEKVESITIVGEGVELDEIKEKIKSSEVKFILEGFKPREFIKNIYAQSHIIILPSESEGFPKVISEAGAYGCIPIVSNVSGIGQHVKNYYNGKLLETRTPKEIANAMDEFLSSPELMKKCSENIISDSEKFSYSSFSKRVENEILKL